MALKLSLVAVKWHFLCYPRNIGGDPLFSLREGDSGVNFSATANFDTRLGRRDVL